VSQLRLSEDEYRDLMRRQGAAGLAALYQAPAAPEPATTPLQRMQALGRLKAGRMNKTEAAYSQHLEGLKIAGAVLWFEFEALTLRLADRTRYTPDFAVLLATGAFELHEVKGHWQDDARVKIKLAAERFPFRFLAVRKLRAKQGGGWATEAFG
jgi:hypothetical protein